MKETVRHRFKLKHSAAIAQLNNIILRSPSHHMCYYHPIQK